MYVYISLYSKKKYVARLTLLQNKFRHDQENPKLTALVLLFLPGCCQDGKQVDPVPPHLPLYFLPWLLSGEALAPQVLHDSCSTKSI